MSWEEIELLYWLDLFGVVVFAVSGALAAGRKSLDLLGVVVIAVVTAVGGGTTRDLLLNRHPVFWIADPTYLTAIIIGTLLTIWYTRHKEPPQKALLLADALGLAVFTITGAQITQEVVSNEVIIVIMAAITGTVGGLIRDVLTNKIPMILQRDIYATAALAGATVYLLLQLTALPSSVNIMTAMIVVIGLRLAAIQWGLHLPRFKLEEE
ncbi:trimeric intracellular cation channel family protein [Aliifodinibius salicampi]|uniref:Trimeric intracellular cation channel family protein n=1 Tax=Fodinibius salicampi TaxID=1920655 RepID=A0ABT3PUZ7_9BACT|nr:trimeric intracellular cation channel family protein [Fodinibius salicampi]MCW9711674.1 trimeric intracellular cation channel family protein [Fodinibius salicampi]